jgi:hypothetical protein
MADEREQPNQMEPLGPEYEALQRRLLADGAVWRAGLPSTERLERRLHALKNQELAAHVRAAGARQSSGFQQLLSQLKGGYTMFQGRLRAALAMTALAAVVVLLVVLFYGFAGGHNTKTGNSPSTTTTTGTPGHINTVPGLSNQHALPQLAPSDPQVAYELQTSASGRLALARTDNSGKSWKTYALPAGQASDQLPPTMFISPLDASTVFVVVGGNRVSGACVVSHALASYARFSGGSNVCALEYISKDGGAHWSQVQFPASGIVGDTAILDEALGSMLGNNVLRPQGSRLYAAFGPYSQDNQLEGTAGARLVASDDGGSTWHFIDNGLTGNGSICDIVPVPTGSTVFAVTSDITCSAGGGQVLTLWRSDTAGAHWSQVGRLPGNTDQGMLAFSTGASAQPVLYINTPTLVGGGISFPHAAERANAVDLSGLQVSTDGGKTWQPAPTKGLPDGTTAPRGAVLRVLQDGSLLFAVSGGQIQHLTTTFYAWKSGDTSWRKLTPAFSGNIQSFLVTIDTSGTQTIWVATSKGAKSAIAYDVQSYQLG